MELANVLDTVIHGDWLDVCNELPAESVDLAITSPPYYNVRKEYAEYPTYAAYLAYIFGWLRGVFRVLKPGKRLVWNIDDLMKSKEFVNCTPSQDSVQLAKQVGFIIKTKVVWVDLQNAEGWLPGTYPNGPNVVINWCAEDVWVFQKPDTWKSHHPRYPALPPELLPYDLMDKEFLVRFARNPIWHIRAESAQRTGHPAPFPEELVAPCVRMWSRPGDVVLDPFLGSGTTALAAMKWRRHFLGVERKEEYVRLANTRIERRRIELMTEQFLMPGLGEIMPRPRQLKLAGAR